MCVMVCSDDMYITMTYSIFRNHYEFKDDHCRLSYSNCIIYCYCYVQMIVRSFLILILVMCTRTYLPVNITTYS